MTPKLDMSQAWNEAVAMIKANRDMVLIVAGVFFLLPNLAMSLLMPLPPESPAMASGAQPDLEPLMAAMGAWFSNVWWVFLIVGLAQAAGTFALLVLLTDRMRPTVGEALGFGVKALPTYLASQIITGLGFAAAFALVIVLAQAVPVVGVLAGLMAMVAALYAMLKLVLVSPVIGIEKQMNPLAAMKRSWRLTKGNSLRILAFFLLLGVAVLVISAVTGLVLSAFSLLGDDIGLIVGALGNGVVTMAVVVVMVAVLAAVYRQLAQTGSDVGETFA